MATAAPEIPVLARDQAFESLYRRYVKDVYQYALALLHNPADAEDVTQTAFLNAYRAYQRGVEIEKPHNWLIKITHNVARTRYAHASRRVKEVPLEDHVAQLAVPEAEQPDLEGVLRALGRLPFNQRAALVMRELEGRTYAEISDTIGVSVSAVETLIFRARKSLRVRASALRSLAAVPLPTSLTQFFEAGGGGVLVGGGTVAGTGFLVKAAVAIIAVALGTGVGGDHRGLATAAADPSTGLALAPSSHGGANGLKAQRTNKLGLRAGRRVAGNNSVAKPAATSRKDGVTALTGAQGAAAQPASSISNTQVSGTQAGPVSQVATTASDPMSSVQQVVAAPAAALPVPVPSLPPVPVAVPPIPLPPPPLPLP
jgi:RNA polymerase sigma factor (sigma-70 family)